MGRLPLPTRSLRRLLLGCPGGGEGCVGGKATSLEATVRGSVLSLNFPEIELASFTSLFVSSQMLRFQAHDQENIRE